MGNRVLLSQLVSRIDKKASSRCLLVSCICLLLLGITIVNTREAVTDGDVWWLLATGREIAENGIPYTNPWSIYGNQGIVVQQWLSAFLLYELYINGGGLALQLLVCCQSIVLSILIFLLCKASSNNEIANDTAWCLTLLVSPVLSIYWSVRPHLWTMIAYVLLFIFKSSFAVCTS